MDSFGPTSWVLSWGVDAMATRVIAGAVALVALVLVVGVLGCVAGLLIQEMHADSRRHS